MALNKEQLREKFQSLLDGNRLAFGATIDRDELLEFYELTNVDDLECQPGQTYQDIRDDIQSADFAELQVSDDIRDRLLDHGRYFGKSGDTYRVELPSENCSRADLYFKSAQKKIDRANRLLKKTPAKDKQDLRSLNTIKTNIYMSEQYIKNNQG